MRPNGQNPGVLQKFAAPPPTLQSQAPTKVAKILIGLENAPSAFNLRNRVIGESGANLHYIRTETGALATLRGRGSMFIDSNTGCESQEPLHLFIEHYSLEGIKEAENLAKNLVETLQQELNYFQDRNSPKPPIPNPPPSAILQQPPQNQVVLAPTHGIPPPPPVLAVPPPPSSHIIQTNGMPQTITNQHISHIHMNPMNVNLPPPGMALSQPPPNVQFQASQVQQQSQPTQILVNQTPVPQYHYQYIQTNGTQIQPGQLTIQHLIQQPQTQQIQGLIPQQIEHLQQTQSSQSIRPPNHHQQIITVQGNTFMVPPPNLQIQQQIFHPQQQHILQHPPLPPGSQPGIQTIQMLQPSIESSQNSNFPQEDGIKEEINEQSSIKTESGSDKTNNQSPSQMPLPPPPLPRSNMLGPPTSITLPLISQPPPSIMSIPPPGIQHHILGNNIITTTQTPTQIIPVSIPQQIQMAPGQQFVTLHSQQWATTTAPQHQQTSAPPPQAPQIQQIHHFPPQMQNIHFTSQTIRQPNEIQFISQQQQQPMTTATFNPQLQPPTGLVQFHQVPSSHIIHQMPSNQTVFEQPPQQGQAQSYQHSQPQFNLQGPPPFGVMQHQIQQPPMSHTSLLPPPPPATMLEAKLNRNEHSPQPMSYQNLSGTSIKSNKRKLEDEDGSPPIPITKPKIGMGSNSGGSTPINTVNNVVSTVTSINSDKNNSDLNPANQFNNQQVDQHQHHQLQLPQQHSSPQSFMQNDHQRPYYQRDSMENFQQDCDEPSGGADYGPPQGGMRNFRPPPFFMGGGRPMAPGGRFGDCYPNRFPPPYRGEGYGPPRYRQQW